MRLDRTCSLEVNQQRQNTQHEERPAPPLDLLVFLQRLDALVPQATGPMSCSQKGLSNVDQSGRCMDAARETSPSFFSGPVQAPFFGHLGMQMKTLKDWHLAEVELMVVPRHSSFSGVLAMLWRPEPSTAYAVRFNGHGRLGFPSDPRRGPGVSAVAPVAAGQPFLFFSSFRRRR